MFGLFITFNFNINQINNLSLNPIINVPYTKSLKIDAYIASGPTLYLPLPRVNAKL